MSFKKKFKRAFKNIIGDFSGVQWRDLDHKKVYCAIALMLLIVGLVVAMIVGLVKKGNDKQTDDTQNPVTEDVQNPGEAEEAVNENPLEKDAYPAVNELVNKYFSGLSAGDTAMVEETVDVLTDEEKQVIERKKDYIEAYNNVICYTKKGLEEGSYVVFAAYDMKIVNIETAAPGIMALYVCAAEDGSLYIFNGEAPEELQNYVLELAAEEEVAAVITEIDTRYQQLAAEDEDLGKFAETMLQSQEETKEEEPEAPAEGNDEQTEELQEPVSTTVTDNVRLRKERSADSEMLDTLAAGTGVKVYANYADGWSKIEYNGVTGYCKTEFLESTEGVPTAEENTTVEENTTTEETAQPAEETQTEENDKPDTTAEVTAVNKQMQFKEAVRIRAERSADSERLANAYTKELVMVIENYSDGWSKVNYNDIVGYCKTEFLEEAQ